MLPPFVANLRSNVVAPHPTCIEEPCGTTLLLDVQGALPNNRNNANGIHISCVFLDGQDVLEKKDLKDVL
jgi:hypothetical protein